MQNRRHCTPHFVSASPMPAYRSKTSTAGRLDFTGNQLAEILEVDVAGHELREGIDDSDDRLAEIAVLHAGGAPKAARARHVAAVGCRS